MKRFSVVALLLSFLLLFIFLTYYPKFTKPGSEATISYDVAGYYFYLPAIFIYHDIHHLEFQGPLNNKYQFSPSLYQGVLLEDSTYTMKYPIGAAVMYAPFFFMAHGYALAAGINADGFSAPYQRMLSLGCLLYAFLGLFVLRKILLKYFSETATGLTLLALVAATNYLNYGAIDNAMTHNLLFTAFTLVIYFTIKFYETPRIRTALLLGFLCGLATITRPTDIIICLIPLLWGVGNWAALKTRLQFFITHLSSIFGFLIMAILIGFIQLGYWKISTGHWIFYSYEEQGFDWLHPHLKDGFFSYKKGWWLYTPFMVSIIPGFYFLYKQHRSIFYSLIMFTVLNIYVAFSWSIWWYGGSLGQRSMVEAYALLAMPIAALFTSILKANKLGQIVSLIFILGCVWINISFTLQAHGSGSILDAEYTNRTYYWQTVGRLHVNQNIKRYLDTDEIYHGTATGKYEIYFNDIENDTLHINANSMLYGKKCLFVDEQNQATQPYAIPIPPTDSKWIRVSADFLTPQKNWDVWKMPQFTVQFKNHSEVVKTKQVRVHRLLESNQKQNISFEIEIPHKPFSTIEIFLWNANGTTTTYMDNIKVEVLE